MKTVLKSAFIFVFAAMVSSCNFFGDKPNNQVGEKPGTETPIDTLAEDGKEEDKKGIDSASTSSSIDSSKESEAKKEVK